VTIFFCVYPQHQTEHQRQQARAGWAIVHGVAHAVTILAVAAHDRAGTAASAFAAVKKKDKATPKDSILFIPYL
jgi:hypothetical protein